MSDDLDANTPVDPASDVGPEATTQEEAFVTGLLASLRADDPAMPDDVVSRLDAVLAEERRGTGAPSSSAVALGDAPDDAPLAGVTVLPTQAERRAPSRTTRTFQIIGGVAAAVVAIGVGSAVITGNLGSGSSSSTTAAGVPNDARAAAGAVGRLQDTGTAYTQKSLATQAAALVTKAKAEGYVAASPVPPGTEPRPDSLTGEATPGATAAPGVARSSVTQETLPSCVAQLAGRTDVVPLAADQGTYDGKAALVVVLPTDGDPASVDVWVVGPVCTATNATLFEFRRIPAPAS